MDAVAAQDAGEQLHHEERQQQQRRADGEPQRHQQRDRQERLGGGDEELVALLRVDRQPVEADVREREDDRQPADQQRPLVDLAGEQRAQGVAALEAPGQEAGDHELG